MTQPTDLAHRSSEALETVIRRVLDDPDRIGVASLATVRAAVASGRFDDTIGQFLPQVDGREVVLREIDGFVATFGEQVPVEHLLHFRAPESLSIVMRDVVAQWHDPERAPILADVRAAIALGRLGVLAGRGLIDADEQETVVEQLNELIRIHGARAKAEDWIGPGDENL